MIDGASPFSAFIRIILPLALPALAITALFSFMAAWSEYRVAAVLIQDRALFTLSMGLKLFQSNMEVAWGLYSAGAVIVSLPVVILFIFLSRWQGVNGLIVVDPGESIPAAQIVKDAFNAALDNIFDKKPVTAIIYTHHHDCHVNGASVFADEHTEIIGHENLLNSMFSEWFGRGFSVES